MTQDFIDALRDGRAPPVTGEDGLAAVMMVEAGYRSHALGQAVSLPLTSPLGAKASDRVGSQRAGPDYTVSGGVVCRSSRRIGSLRKRRPVA